MRASGLSYRQIGERLGISVTTAHNDCRRAEEQWGEIATDPEILREGLLQLHAKLSGGLMQSLEEQLRDGQLTQDINANGEVVRTQRRNWPSPQIAAELSRNLQRMAVLMGLTDAPVEGGSQQTTVIQLTAPTDGPSFEQRWASAEAVDVTATERPPGGAQSAISGSGEASPTPDASEAA